MKKIAVPLTGKVLCPHFGHCVSFRFYSVENEKIIKVEEIPTPPHQPGFLPQWLTEKGATDVIASGIGGKAVQLMEANGIKVTKGAQPEDPDQIVQDYLAGNLEVMDKVCNHHHGECQH